MSFLIYLLAIVAVAASQTCRSAGMGQCNANKYCGPAATCTSIGTADEACCANTDVVLIPPPLPTIKPVPATTAKPCVDKVNPSTGVSDCTRMASYCTNSAYYDLMTQQCPATCGRCTGSVTSGTCVDKVNPSTGVSDCTRMASYCTNSAYYTLMTEQCPRTCGRCTGTVTTAPTTCVDKINPSTGVSDCTRMASYCNNAVYYDLMTDQCPRTCNRCSGGPAVTQMPATCVDKVNPATGISDCTRMASYCNNAVYFDLMNV